MAPKPAITEYELEHDAIWADPDRALGQLMMVGFEGTTVTPQIRQLIEQYHVGSILLVAKNLKSAEETTQLILNLQQVAFNAGHPIPLAIGLDQENGGVNSLLDEIYIRQYPSAMGVAATGSKELAFEVAKATAEEIASCGVNLIMGPCLDVLTNARNQPLGVRTTGDDPQEVSDYGIAFMRGYKSAGVATMGKHFPSYGNLEFLGSALELPVIAESLEQLSLSALIPFKNAIAHGLDAMMVGGCAMSSAGLEIMHACLSDQVIDGLLRKDLHFDGVVISECLEMEALSQNIGVGGGTVMAVNAGCDLVLLCRSFAFQKDAIQGLKLGIESLSITTERVKQSLRRVLTMKESSTSWEKALNPPGLSYLSILQPSHTALSTRAYNKSITVVRDRDKLLPLANLLEPEEELLLLTPLVKPLAASAAARAVIESMEAHWPEPAAWERSASVMSGERVFRELGRSLARQRNGKVSHTSYTGNGVRPIHENLISRASAVIVVTADANRNIYQQGFTKHVALICSSQFSAKSDGKPLIVVACSSPYDFALDLTLGTYICTYDFTETALNSLVQVLYGEISAAGALPGSISQNQKLQPSRQHWLVESYNEERDALALDALIHAVIADCAPNQRSELTGASSIAMSLHLPDVLEAHFVVRNSSTHALYGFCSTYFFKDTGTGVLGALFVDPTRRNLSIGRSLHHRAISMLLTRDGVRRFQLGSRLPNIFLGIPSGPGIDRRRLRSWFANLGWNTALSRPVCSMIVRNLAGWNPPEGIAASLPSAGVEFDLVYGWDYAMPVLEHVKTSNRQGLVEIYKLALNDPAACTILRARRSEDGALLGTVVLYSAASQLAEFVMPIKAADADTDADADADAVTGGMSSPVISPFAGDYGTLLQGMILLGVRQIKQQGASACILDHMTGDEHCGGLSGLGFEVLHAFEEIACDAMTWAQTAQPPPT